MPTRIALPIASIEPLPPIALEDRLPRGERSEVSPGRTECLSVNAVKQDFSSGIPVYLGMRETSITGCRDWHL
jgi:hypothetical protein